MEYFWKFLIKQDGINEQGEFIFFEKEEEKIIKNKGTYLEGGLG